MDGLSSPIKLFEGDAREAALAFPANANVAASLSLAGIGPERTRVEIWAVPGLKTLKQAVLLQSDSCVTRVEIESYPLQDNPRTGSLTPKSVISSLRSLVSALRVGG